MRGGGAACDRGWWGCTAGKLDLAAGRSPPRVFHSYQPVLLAGTLLFLVCFSFTEEQQQSGNCLRHNSMQKYQPDPNAFWMGNAWLKQRAQFISHSTSSQKLHQIQQLRGGCQQESGGTVATDAFDADEDYAEELQILESQGNAQGHPAATETPPEVAWAAAMTKSSERRYRGDTGRDRSRGMRYYRNGTTSRASRRSNRTQISAETVRYITRTGDGIGYLQRCYQLEDRSVVFKFRANEVVFIDPRGGIFVSTGGHFNNGTYLSLKMVLENLGFSVTCPNGPLSPPYVVSNGTSELLVDGKREHQLLPFMSTAGVLSGEYLIDHTHHLRKKGLLQPLPQPPFGDERSGQWDRRGNRNVRGAGRGRGGGGRGGRRDRRGSGRRGSGNPYRPKDIASLSPAERKSMDRRMQDVIAKDLNARKSEEQAKLADPVERKLVMTRRKMEGTKEDTPEYLTMPSLIDREKSTVLKRAVIPEVLHIDRSQEGVLGLEENPFRDSSGQNDHGPINVFEQLSKAEGLSNLLEKLDEDVKGEDMVY